MLKASGKKILREKRKRRIRAQISGTAKRPRVTVFRSLKGLYLQAIDDQKGVTLCQANLRELGAKAKNNLESAEKIGKRLADHLEKQGIQEAVFDRAGYRYHGKVKAVAEALRKNGIKI